MLVEDSELARRRTALEAGGGYPSPPSQSPWQDIFRERVRPFAEGMVLDGAPDFKGIAHKSVPRNNH